MADTKKTEKKFSTYKGRPLVRCNDEIYYGSMEEPYVIRMQIKSKKRLILQLQKNYRNGLKMLRLMLL